MKTFYDLNFKQHPTGKGIQAIEMFDNGYGVSVVQTPNTYGSEFGLYEMAILDSEGHITYNTSITNDVLGYLSKEDVTKQMENVQKLITYKFK